MIVPPTPKVLRMPTVNPRINVTLPPSLDLLVSRMAAHQRVSKSQVLREILEASEPSLRKAVALMDAAEQAKRDLLTWKIDHSSMVPSFKDGAVVMVDSFDLVDQAERVSQRRPARRGAALPTGDGSGGADNPPTSNRGVKSDKQAENVGTTSSRSSSPEGGSSAF